MERGRFTPAYTGDTRRSPPSGHPRKEGPPYGEDRAEHPDFLPVDVAGRFIGPERKTDQADDEPHGQGCERANPHRAPGNRPASPFGFVIHECPFEKVSADNSRFYKQRGECW